MFSIVEYFANEIQILVLLVSPDRDAVLLNGHLGRRISNRLSG